MGLLPKKWLKWIAVVTGVAGILALILLELGWLPAEQAHNAVIFLLSFIILDGVAARQSSDAGLAPELFTNSEDSMSALTGLVPDIKREMMAVVQGNFIESEGGIRFAKKVQDRMRSEKNLHNYVIVAAPIAEMSEESFRRRLALEGDPSIGGRMHYRFIDTPVSFGCQVIDENHWEIDFPPNPAETKGVAIIFRNHPESAHLVASFIRHQWLERPGLTMSLSEAYERWKVIKAVGSTEPAAAGTTNNA